MVNNIEKVSLIMTSKERYTEFFKLESKYKLFNIKFKNKYPLWGAYRIYFNYFDLRNKNLFDTPVVIVSFSFKSLLNYSKVLFRCNICKIFLKRKKYIILEHPRSKEDVDIYTQNIVNIIGKESLRLSFTQEFKNLRKDTIYLDTYKIISKIIAKIFSRFLNKNKFQDYKAFIEEFKSDLTLYEGFKDYYLEFIVMFYFYRLLLKFHRPKIVFLVVGYENAALLGACRELDIRTIEIQHGLIYKYHLGYGYPLDAEKYTNILPNDIMTLSEYWEKNIYLPESINIFPLGNDYVAVSEELHVKKEESILFISQGVIGGQLADFLESNINNLCKYTIYFKLHPSEFSLVNDKYASLLEKEKQHKNFKIVCDETSIDALQLLCEYQVGVFSTAIYEGLQRGCKTIVLNIDGIEAIEDLIENNYVQVCDMKGSLLDILNINERKNIKHIFFKPFNKRLFLDMLEE